MKNKKTLFLSSLLFFFALAAEAKTAADTLADKFLGSPLLILAAVLIIVAVAFAYHKIRK